MTQIIGQTAKGTRIEATVTPANSSRTVVLVGAAAAEAAHPFNLIAIPNPSPDGAKIEFPPTGAAYRENTESHVLWRWIGVHAPDLVLVTTDQSALAAALSSQPVALMGRIPARVGGLADVPGTIEESEAHKELTNRLGREPRQVATEFAGFYGHNLDQVMYINTVALIAQLRLGNLAEVQKLAESYASGAKDGFARPGSTVLPGYLLFAELYERTGDARYAALVRKVADAGFLPNGEMKESMPYHDEMSDSVFMGTPLLARAGRLTGERRYYDMAERHLQFMQRIGLRGDGLYRHSPLAEAAWGRGNAFPALGLALTVSDMPREHRAYRGMAMEFQHHMEALARNQDADGMWHEVIDEPGSYAEYTATAMIGCAMLRGIRGGFLPRDQFQSAVDRAWAAVKARTGSDGKLVNVCESTGKMKSLTEYLNRLAIMDSDARGGAMGMLFATEMAGLK